MCTREFIPPEECAAYTATCDLGCDLPTVALVQTAKGEWLSGCAVHAAAVLSPPEVLAQVKVGDPDPAPEVGTGCCHIAMGMGRLMRVQSEW